MKIVIGLAVTLGLLVFLPSLQYAFAIDAPGEYLDRRAEIWGMFYRLMLCAFIIGAIVQGTMVWLILRFRESNPKAKPTKYEKAGEW